ncbi:unknown [Clostridium sp. CAG:306]|nr:unknown [Clostridium sp. CAG:306]
MYALVLFVKTLTIAPAPTPASPPAVRLLISAVISEVKVAFTSALPPVNSLFCKYASSSLLITLTIAAPVPPAVPEPVSAAISKLRVWFSDASISR